MPPGKESRKPPKRKSGGLLLFLLLGGGGLLLVGIVVVLLLVFKGGGLGGGNPAATRENWEKIDFGMTKKEVAALLGEPGSDADAEAVRNLLANRERPGGFKQQPPAPLRNAGGSLFTVWRNGGNHIIVGFVPSEEYGELSTYAGWFAEIAGGSEYGERVITPFELEKSRARREQEKQQYADPKWKKGPELRKLLAGVWMDKLTGYEFKADGTMAHLLQWGPDLKRYEGSYKFIDDEHIEINHESVSHIGPKKINTVAVLKVLVTETELMLPMKLSDGKYIGGVRYRREGRGKKK